jgi:hypothetical protein
MSRPFNINKDAKGFKQIGVRISPKLHAAACRKCSSLDKRLSEVVRDFLRTWAKEKR